MNKLILFAAYICAVFITWTVVDGVITMNTLDKDTGDNISSPN